MVTDGDETCEKRANDMLNRNKIQPKGYNSEQGRDILKGADVIIVDGDVVIPKVLFDREYKARGL